MIVVILFAFTVFLLRLEGKASEALRLSRLHPSIANPALPGSEVALEWEAECDAATKAAKGRADIAEASAIRLGRVALIGAAALAVLRIVAAAMAAASTASLDAAGVAGWGVVVDGIDVLLWVAAVL